MTDKHNTFELQPLNEDQIIEIFEKEIMNDPDAYLCPDEVVYQITRKELIEAAKSLIAHSYGLPVGYMWASVAEKLQNRELIKGVIWAQPEGDDPQDPELTLYAGPKHIDN